MQLLKVNSNPEVKPCVDLFISSNASICSTMGFPPLRNSDHVVVSVSIDFPSNLQWDALFYCIASAYSCAALDFQVSIR